MNKLIIVSAPSGAGKTTIVKQILKMNLPLEFSISACSRAIRNGEVEGKDYYFMSVESFKQKILKNEFLEWEQVYEGNYYGTLYSEIDRIWSNNNSVIFDVDVVGGLNIKKKFQNNSISIFIKPPSIEILEQRLRNRSTETEENILKRITKSKLELTFANRYDYVVVNDNLELAINDTKEIIERFIFK